jgi:2-pyrone-4,6-dicarboxylate lactonase
MSALPKFRMDDGWLEFHPHPSEPTFVLPPRSVDAHCHVFGPGDRFPYVEKRKYTPCDAPKEKLWALRDHLGFRRGRGAQSSFGYQRPSAPNSGRRIAFGIAPRMDCSSANMR